MAERNARSQKCDDGQHVIENGNGNEKEGGVEEKGLMKKEDDGEKGKVEEEVGVENGNGAGVENTFSHFDDKMVVEKWCPRNFTDLDHEWPPFPWSLENIVEEKVLWRWDSNPYWDIELMQGGQAYEEDEEVIWEDDVWHLRDIKEVPMKPSKGIIGSPSVSF